MLNHIFSRLYAAPTKLQIANLLEKIENECLVGYNLTAKNMMKSIEKVSVVVSTVPKEIVEKIIKKLSNFVEILNISGKARDGLY